MLYPSEDFLYAPVEWQNCSEGYSDILYHKSKDGIAKITINRPEVRNAFRPHHPFRVSNKQDYLKHGMDDVLQKPLSLDALNKCLLQLFNLQPENSSDKEKQENFHEVEITPSAQDKQWPQLDLSILDELYEILGKQAIQNNLKLFVATMPEYLQQLMQEYQRYLSDPQQKLQLTETAHKMKGAAASVGLKQLQQICKAIQDGDREDWQTQLAARIEQLQSWQQHVAVLQRWLDRK